MAFFVNTDLNNENNKIKQIDLDLESLDFNLDEELIDAKTSSLKSFQYWYEDISANIYKYFVHRPLIGYSFKRIIYGLMTLLVAVVILFILVRIVTPDTQYLPENWNKMGLNEAQLQSLLDERMKKFGVYGPIGEQLLNYLKNIFPLIPKEIPVDYEFALVNNEIVKVSEVTETRWIYLGVVSSTSIATPESDVLQLFSKAIPYSLAFGSVAVCLSYLIGVPLGIQAAKKKGKILDSAINGFSVLLVAVPGLVIVLGLYLLSVSGLGQSGLFSSGSFWTKFWPIVVLMLMMTPSTIILTRRYVIDEMTADYTKFAYSKGLGSTKVFYVHIFRNAGIRILKQFPLDLAVTLFGASILTEQQWAIPGMARYIVAAIGGTKDSFVILGYVSFASFITIFSSLISDLFLVAMDPRVNLNKK
ncbi:oligopeptide ABC transporter permease [Williamsoniiplasma somnilux]|uniref:Oligopeptide ABC transporter permease n=1 Tax=Williamsoniiplasma somnilux TaxID=215578 RepID=A0A2K8P1K7_9MOLU|nr:oligopeptide ABC transporter permease OppB [Williamsoniiplasma somnilux]ATZ18891.1 oligopeptide ABC transporter permease [Williamsoniiplasma somnilux]